LLSEISENPLFTVICLCFNHEKHVIESLDSVVNQSYKNIEIIIVDDFSSDNSTKTIQNWLKVSDTNLNISFIKNKENKGHTTSFNIALEVSKGCFVIDLATDDLLNKDCVENHFNNFKKNPNSGVSFSNVENVDVSLSHLNFFYRIKESENYVMDFKPQSGNLYNELLAKFYINACGMCVKREVYQFLNGYDSSLDYEDFDFWVRSSFVFKYCYGDFISVKKRILEDSHSTLANTIKKNQFRRDLSTYKVCLKAYRQNKTQGNYKALNYRIIHELKMAVRTTNYILAKKYVFLYIRSYLKNCCKYS